MGLVDRVSDKNDFWILRTRI